MTAAIFTSDLRKSFGTVRALDGLDLTVASGEGHGVLGPNGAGKTTLIRVLLGLLRADGGEARLLGGDPWTDATQLRNDERASVESAALRYARFTGRRAAEVEILEK